MRVEANHDQAISKKGNLLLAAGGITLFAWVIAHAGVASVFLRLKALRIALPIVVALSIGRLLLQTFSWSAALKSEGLEVAARRLMGVRMASQGMGYLTVFGPALSEPLKIKLLETPVASTATATFLENGVYWFTSALIAIVGLLCAGSLRTQNSSSVAVLASVFALLMVFMASRRSVLSAASNGLGKRSPTWLHRGAEIESAIRKSRTQNPKLVAKLFWLSMGCQFLLVAEVAVVLWCLRLPLHVATVVAIEALTRAVKMMTGWLPARLGADEGGAVSAFAASGLLPAFGLTLAFTRRARDLSWALIGLFWLAWRSRAAKQQLEEEEPEGRNVFDGGILPCKS